MELKTAEKEVSYGVYSKKIKVKAYICQKCGERMYTSDAENKIRKLEEEMISASQVIE